jgi:methylmalonyl-CoA/ethylmalonyl-CoA epimerase
MRVVRDRPLLGTCLVSLAINSTFLTSAGAKDVAKPTVDLSLYRHVAQVGWVVKDLDRVVEYWEKLGLRNIRRSGIVDASNTIYRGRKSPLKLKMAFGNVGGVQIEWIQPVSGKSIYDEFLAKHGEGVHHLAYAMPSPKQLDTELRHFKTQGVEAAQYGSWIGSKGQGRFVYLDTAPRGGGLTIELLYDPDVFPQRETQPVANEYPFTKIAQYALVVRNVKEVSSYYESLGFGGMPIDHNISVNRLYRGQPGRFEMYLGWWHWGDVTFEWIQSLVGPSVYDEYLKAHGEGFHHFAFEVRDMGEAIKLLEARGAPVAQSGGWDSPSSKGRFAYMNSEPYGGVTIELLWNAP